jgi:Arylsulfotransferase Ig-like domain
LTLAVSDTTVLKSIQFTITPKPGSVTRPLSGTYFNNYLLDRGFENPTTGAILLPVYGLYDGYANTVRLTYSFLDGSSKQANTIITTAPANPSESATLQTLAPGAYTAIEAAADGSRVWQLNSFGFEFNARSVAEFQTAMVLAVGSSL